MNEITLEKLKKDEEIQVLIDTCEEELGALGFTEHSNRHLGVVVKFAEKLLKAINASEREMRLGLISAYLHDIGNAVNRFDHAQSGAILAYNLLTARGMGPKDAAEVMLAIGNHDEESGHAVSRISACLILADKSDVHRTRVRSIKNWDRNTFDVQSIHDRVNYASINTDMDIDVEKKTITLEIEVDTRYCSVMDYFEIYISRMSFCKSAARYLGFEYGLEINKNKLI